MLLGQCEAADIAESKPSTLVLSITSLLSELVTPNTVRVLPIQLVNREMSEYIPSRLVQSLMAALAPFLAHAATLVVWSGRKESSGLPGSSLQDCVRVHVCWHLLPYKLTCACKCMSVDP